MPPRTTRKSYRPRVSDRTMVGTLQPPCLSVSDTEWRRHRRKMKPLGWRNKSTCRISRRVKSLRRQARKNPSFITWAGKSENIRPQEGCFFLTSPFMATCQLKGKSSGNSPHLQGNIGREKSEKKPMVSGIFGAPCRRKSKPIWHFPFRGRQADVTSTQTLSCPVLMRKSLANNVEGT